MVSEWSQRNSQQLINIILTLYHCQWKRKYQMEMELELAILSRVMEIINGPGNRLCQPAGLETFIIFMISLEVWQLKFLY